MMQPHEEWHPPRRQGSIYVSAAIIAATAMAVFVAGLTIFALWPDTPPKTYDQAAQQERDRTTPPAKRPGQ